MIDNEKYVKTWCIRENDFVSAYNKYYESVFTLGNGYLGTRGSLEEGCKESIVTTLIAGLFDKMPEEVTELANAANWLPIKLIVNDEPI